MAWSPQARMAAATARRAKRGRGGRVSYSDRAFGSVGGGKKVYGGHAFEFQASLSKSKHRYFSPPMKFSDAKARVMSSAKAISKRLKQTVYVSRLP